MTKGKEWTSLSKHVGAKIERTPLVPLHKKAVAAADALSTPSVRGKARGRVNGKPNPIDVHVGRRLRLRRTLLNMTQESLAKALGLTFQQVQKYERGANRISASTLFDICRVLDVSPAFFFDDMPPEVVRLSPAVVRKGQFEEGDSYRVATAQEPMDRQSALLIKHFTSVMDPALKARILALVAAMAGSDVAEGDE